MAKKSSMPNLANATPEFLIDEIGKLAEERKANDKMEKFYKEALKARVKDLKLEFVVGEKYEGSITESCRISLDGDLIKSEMGQEWYDNHCKQSAPFLTIKTGKVGTLKNLEEEDIAE